MIRGPGTQYVDTQGGAAIQGNVYLPSGDFIGRDQYKNYYIQQVVSVFMPRVGADVARESRAPYLAGRPFQIADRDLFTGREAERAIVLQQIHNPTDRTTVIYGPPAVGKTSFLSAGVLPQLADSGAEVLPVRDYGAGVPFLRALLASRALELHVEIPQQASVPELMRMIVETSGRRLILVLDQFERFFLPEVPAADRDAWREMLVEACRIIDPTAFQVLIAVRAAWQSALDRAWGAALPGLRQTPVHLAPFSYEQARTAILYPTRVLSIQPVFDEAFLEQQLLPDLDRLSPQQVGQISPCDLQIVCHHLHQRARAKGMQSIQSPLYFEVTQDKGAEWILDQHLEGLLDQVSGARRGLAKKIATELLAQADAGWINPRQLSLTQGEGEALILTLEEMTQAGIFVWHMTEETERAYTFASYSIASAAERALGRGAQKSIQARRESVYVWRDWLVQGQLADAHQLQILAQYPPTDFPVERVLVMLRSAVAGQLPVQPWLEHLESETTRSLLCELEKGEVERDRLTQRHQTAHILGLFDSDISVSPASEEFGPLTWTAVTHPQQPVRETAVLALLSAYGEKVILRLQAATSATGWSHRQQRQRLTELCGVLLDARPALEESIRKRSWGLWLLARGWRFGRHFKRNWDYVLLLTLGGSMTAAFSVALLRAGLSFWADRPVGETIYNGFSQMAFLSVALTLGLLLADLTRVNSVTTVADAAASRPLIPALAGGTLLFTLTYWGMIILKGTDKLLVWALGVPVAIGLSWAISGHPVSTWRRYLRRLPYDLVVPVVIASFVQALFEFNSELGESLAYTWPGNSYDRLPDWLCRIGNVTALVGIGDAALTALVMAGGLTLGLFWSYELYRTWTKGA